MKIANAVNTLLCASALSLLAASVQASVTGLDKPFNENYWVTTHNSYEKINQNLKEMPQQLRDGVRGFMLDIYPDEGKSGANRIKVCHKKIACYGAFSNHLKNEFIPFLKANPTEVVTIFLETYVERQDLQQVFDSIPELGNYSFNPANFPPARWPTPKEMTAQNNRLILMTDKREVAGNYTVNGKTVSVLFDQDWIVQNHWDTLGVAASNIEKAHNWSCPTRWDWLPLSTGAVASSTQKQWPRLFLMNQFHTATSTVPDSAAYDNNLTYLLRRAANCGIKPNFVGINNYQNGDAFGYTKTLTEGGIFLWEGNNADMKQDAVCALPTEYNNFKFPTRGCENDEARSMSISGLKKGTRIIAFDDGNGDRSDDYTIVDIKRDIGTDEDIVLGSFETNVNNDTLQAVYIRNNGLDGKVSRITIGIPPNNFDDGAIAMYEGNNATQNLICTVPFNSAHSFGMKSKRYGCNNDEIRSAKIVKAKAGTSFIVRGHPNGNDSEGKAVVTIKRDIHLPVVINSFDKNFEDADLKVVKTGKGLDGKISHGEFNGAR
ncbi:MAG TPA: hypothetical protein VF682_09680 [Pseudomonas sp.]